MTIEVSAGAATRDPVLIGVFIAAIGTAYDIVAVSLAIEVIAGAATRDPVLIGVTIANLGTG